MDYEGLTKLKKKTGERNRQAASIICASVFLGFWIGTWLRSVPNQGYHIHICAHLYTHTHTHTHIHRFSLKSKNLWCDSKGFLTFDDDLPKLMAASLAGPLSSPWPLLLPELRNYFRCISVPTHSAGIRICRSWSCSSVGRCKEFVLILVFFDSCRAPWSSKASERQHPGCRRVRTWKHSPVCQVAWCCCHLQARTWAN